MHTAQLMPLPLTASCFSKIQIGFTSLVPAHLGSTGKGAVKRARACVCVCNSNNTFTLGGLVAGWFAYWTQAQKGLGSNRSRDAVR